MNMELDLDQSLYLGSTLTTNLIYPRANASSIGLHKDLGLTTIILDNLEAAIQPIWA